MELTRLRIKGDQFVDASGRTVILRGVNLGGDCKVPFTPNESTHLPTDFSNHREVSFIGRPFPLAEAQEHFSRLSAWGFNVLRLLTTWEAVEHKGPGDYDTQYLDYYAELCRLAGEHGLYVFVDFHQDVWSRMTGGDGAPCWVFEKIGIDYTKLAASGSAIVMQSSYDYNDPRPRQEDNYPTMCWSQNYKYPANGIMWTLFFAGRDFAPQFMIDGQNVQDYLQGHYMACQLEIARRVKDFPNVIGFDSLNEPGKGWIGREMDDRRLAHTKEKPSSPGIAWSPLDALYAACGHSVDLPELEVSIIRRGLVPKRIVRMNPNAVSIWRDGMTDPFQAAGAWRLKPEGGEVIRNDFFATVGGKQVEFNRDYMFPFIHRVAENVRSINGDWFIFAEKDAIECLFDNPDFPEDTPANLVNASHWYDMFTLLKKNFSYPMGIDMVRQGPVFFESGIQKMYERQLGAFRKASEKINGGAPTLVGECGIPFDIQKGKAYAKFAKGDRSSKPWKKHVMALDLMYNALDALLLHSTQWNYTASNSNDQRIGDGWNQEDLSIYSADQRTDPSDINSGGRALEGIVRPFARFIQGKIISVSFNRRSGEFILRYIADVHITLPTEIFVPRLQYTSGYRIITEGAEVREDSARQVVLLTATRSGEITVRIAKRC